MYKSRRKFKQEDRLSQKVFTKLLQYAFRQLYWSTKGMSVDGEMLSLSVETETLLRQSTDLELSENVKVSGNQIASVHKYNYLGHIIITSRVNQTIKLKEEITLAIYGNGSFLFHFSKLNFFDRNRLLNLFLIERHEKVILSPLWFLFIKSLLHIKTIVFH